MIDLEELKKDIAQIVQQTEIFNQQDFAWILSILYRLDGRNGIDQLRPLVLLCEKYNKEKTGFTPFQCYMAELEINHALMAAKALYCRQRSILIGVPQRKKHSKFTVPNLAGFIPSQTLKVEIDTCFGLGFCDSRQYFVDKALQKGKDYTHILFLDDDILIPLNALTMLINQNEPIVCANYTKRSVLLESVCTSTQPDQKFIYSNQSVEPKQNDYSLVPVTAMGLGCTLVEVDVFRKIKPPFFEFVHDTFEDGRKRNLLLGEDTYFTHKAIISGYTPKVITGLTPVHTDLKTGYQFGPEWLVDSSTHRLKPAYEQHYCKFPCPTKELYTADIDTIFNNPIR